MKITNCLFGFTLFISNLILAQDGKILNKEPLVLHDSILNRIGAIDTFLRSELNHINFYRITYLSDGLKVTGYIAEPKEKGRYPCIISNRGGNREFGQWEPLSIAISLGRMASWNYVVVASQYRGNDGGEGKEEFGGKDIHDVLNLIPVLSQLPNADTARIGIHGVSRGGIMTYQALKNTCRFKAAVVISGAANSFTNIASRPDMETNVYAELVPDYRANKEKELKARSAVFWADKMCKTTPLLIMHGSSDWRVPPSESLELVQKLYEFKHPTRFIFFEGSDHGISEFRVERNAETKRHFDYYVRDQKKWPSMEPHGQ
jgi:dipeptidyl aminopeptidase/acylaminoacyl peptidase